MIPSNRFATSDPPERRRERRLALLAAIALHAAAFALVPALSWLTGALGPAASVHRAAGRAPGDSSPVPIVFQVPVPAPPAEAPAEEPPPAETPAEPAPTADAGNKGGETTEDRTSSSDDATGESDSGATGAETGPMDFVPPHITLYLDEPTDTRSQPRLAGTGGVTVPTPIADTVVEPVLPEGAGQVLAEGSTVWVVLRVLVTRDGAVERVEVIQAPPDDPGFAPALVEAVSQWRFEPARLRGRPVDAWHTLVHPFTKNGQSGMSKGHAP